MNQLATNNSIGVAMDLRDFYISTEWDVMEVPAQRNEKYYPCCEVRHHTGGLVDFNLNMNYRNPTRTLFSQ